MQRWVFGGSGGSSVIRGQLSMAGESEKLVTFLDFVQILAVRQVRVTDSKFPLQRIREACDLAAKKYDLPYPLAAKDHRIFLFGPKDNPKRCEMVIEIGGQYLQISGKCAGNYVINEIAEPFMRRLRFGNTPFAEEYIAWEREDRRVLMNPHKRFGEPYLPNSGYTAQALWEAYRNEGSVERAAKSYGVDVEDIETACEYLDHLTGRDAA